MDLDKKIFKIQNENEFNRIALEVYNYQAKNNSVYKEYIKLLNLPKPKCIKEIPFLPISFFKTHDIITNDKSIDITFKSSGTTGIKSQHHVSDIKIYIKTFNLIYNKVIGNPKDQVIIALLPNYKEQKNSSLIYMVDDLINKTNNQFSGYFLSDIKKILLSYNEGLKAGKKVIIFGVSYSLLDLAKLNLDLSQAIIIETGGMKGKRKEISKKDLHSILRKGLNNKSIYSEYGMTELLSQSYSINNEIFKESTTIRILIRDINDPFNYVADGKTGGINIIDLANINSCSFIATQDLGRIVPEGFKLMGRFDHSDTRGCNLMLQ